MNDGTLPRGTWLALLALCAATRFAPLPLNVAEYTDGILQLTQFERPTGIWPPLYTALAWPLGKLLDPLWAGRLVSAVASTLALIPLVRLAVRFGDLRAAVPAALLYIAAPVALRWAPRVMTEALFSVLFWWSCERMLTAWELRQVAGAATRAFVVACVAGALAALTRYQGMVLAPMLLLVGALAVRGRGIKPIALGALVLFALQPLWSSLAGNIHGEQFDSRLGGDLQTAAFVISQNGEAFLLWTPFFLTYPVALWALAGIFRSGSPQLPLLWVTVLVGAVLVFVQAMFSSFQERYLLPWFGFLWVFGGIAAGRAMGAPSVVWRRAARAAFAFTLVVSFAVAGAVLVGSREVWGDVRGATELALESSPPDARIVTDEVYRGGNPPIAGDKVRFFAKGRAVLHLSQAQPLRAGDVLVLLDVLGGERTAAQLSDRYALEPIGETHAAVLPYFPEIMARPGVAQNPLAWFYRYEMQHFTTRVYRVRAVR